MNEMQAFSGKLTASVVDLSRVCRWHRLSGLTLGFAFIGLVCQGGARPFSFPATISWSFERLRGTFFVATLRDLWPPPLNNDDNRGSAPCSASEPVAFEESMWNSFSE